MAIWRLLGTLLSMFELGLWDMSSWDQTIDDCILTLINTLDFLRNLSSMNILSCKQFLCLFGTLDLVSGVLHYDSNDQDTLRYQNDLLDCKNDLDEFKMFWKLEQS